MATIAKERENPSFNVRKVSRRGDRLDPINGADTMRAVF